LPLLTALAAAAADRATMGAAGIPLARLPAALACGPRCRGAKPLRATSSWLWSIRIPRIAAAAMVGALLAASGAIMQGLFRNPPRLPRIGSAFPPAARSQRRRRSYSPTARSAKASASCSIIFAAPVAAFAGSLVTTVVLYSIASRSGRTSIAIFLLAGIAIAAIANLPVSDFWYSSPTTPVCAISRSGCWAR